MTDGDKETNDPNIYFRSPNYKLTGSEPDPNLDTPPPPTIRYIQSGMQVRVYTGETNYDDLEKWLKNFKAQTLSVNPKNFKDAKKTKTGGENSYYINYVSTHGEKLTLVAILHKGVIYYIEYEGKIDNDWSSPERMSDLKTLDLMLSTFKFD